MLKAEEMIKAGCSPSFTKMAMQYSPMYNNDIEFFIQEVEEMLRVPRTAQRIDTGDSDYSDAGCYQAAMDLGVRIAERDYTGDLLTYYGYEYTINNRRG